ncbi:hypothetical protein FNJ84_21060 [Paracoccus sp. M683]|uniref:hypothetical protein n=1 Tax=Paracoccus sp. M683 TaxID=2594268 RepID=UPI00117DAD29|nr:hypothetical protein [Paracoccus sp. M683]TRW92239.1 hypothetical protein FNJ84_21060 [Paracoccus sp. M683]
MTAAAVPIIGTGGIGSRATAGDALAPQNGRAGAGHWWDVAVPQQGGTDKLRAAYARYLVQAARQAVVN